MPTVAPAPVRPARDEAPHLASGSVPTADVLVLTRVLLGRGFAMLADAGSRVGRRALSV